MISVKMLLPALLVVVAAAGPALGSPEQVTYGIYRREGREEPASSYASPPVMYGSPEPTAVSQPSYGSPEKSYGPPPKSYKMPAPMMYAYIPHPMPMEEEKEEEKKEKEKKKKPETKEEKKCAVRLVLPPLIIITIFIGCILIQLVVPDLVAAVLAPVVNPLVAVIQAITAQTPVTVIRGARAMPGNDVSDPALQAFDSLLQLTGRVTAALSPEGCLATLLCDATDAVPHPDLSSRLLKYALPTRYHSYVNILTRGKENCKKQFPCNVQPHHTNLL
ncbi:uncharacterized protein LOC108677463 [Hyalella azteca]|uniref:Uncharacterized protein LOC108677463 n=1 Tax=Hyalella azteca TaxID=294128 RepID=A0A8B7P4V4_HYAAZ|nr:uncharacterized protein LOC108677463 [Hyalella azteca]